MPWMRFSLIIMIIHSPITFSLLKVFWSKRILQIQLHLGKVSKCWSSSLSLLKNGLTLRLNDLSILHRCLISLVHVSKRLEVRLVSFIIYESHNYIVHTISTFKSLHSQKQFMELYYVVIPQKIFQRHLVSQILVCTSNSNIIRFNVYFLHRTAAPTIRM